MTAKEKLTSLADSIRNLDGVSGSLSLDEMTFKITNANAAVTDTLEALASRGVTIPDGAKISDLAGLVGSVEGGIDTTDATATADEIFDGETAYVNGNKVTGTFTIASELSTQDDLITQIQTALQNKASASEPVLQTKTVTPTTSQQTVKPDSGYDGLSQVTVNAMTTATQATPSISVSSSGLITASATQTAGYVSAGTKSATKQLTVQAAKTVTPSTSSQTAVASGRYTTGAVTVAAIPSTYVQPSGTKTITTNGTYDVKSYASATVNVAGEDVTDETNAYTSKLATLETAITALETELQGKASGGSGGGGESVETCTVSISFNEGVPRNLLISGTQLVDNVVQTFVVNTYNGGDTFSSPYNIVNIIKNSPLTIVGNGSYMLGPVECSGCELLCNANGMSCTLLKITDSNASVTINNVY